MDENLVLLTEIVDLLDPPATMQQLWKWSAPSTDNGFPEPKMERRNRKFYSAKEITEWYAIHKRLTANYNNGRPNG